ncbi:acetyltransferase [Maribacter sp. TH_r10]|uniref:acetyltransferase n=1 Tax=Maribacter sp. TH_r10 TaxID=3082086 RepID=UPI002953CE81|nr:acetyltransferase [Maribacter sp. TH_r10]MDV7137750.1 acetyltransferase [Maribacter sp. TH_r10]
MITTLEFTKKKTIVLGAGGHGKVVASILIQNEIDVFGFYDDNEEYQGKSFMGIPVLGKISDLKSDKNVHAIIAIGDNSRRKELAQKFDFYWINAIHPFTSIDPSAKIGVGNVICAGVIIQRGSRLGNHNIVNTKTSLDHDCTVTNYCHMASANVAGSVNLKEGAFLALNSSVLPNLNIGEWSIVGAGAVVIKDISPNKVAIGVPAKEVRKTSRERCKITGLEI